MVLEARAVSRATPIVKSRGAPKRRVLYIYIYISLTMPMVTGRCARDAPLHTFNIGALWFVETNSTTIKHIYNESANIIEGCNVPFDTKNCWNLS